jgi:uncharacterized repeat protein (TIGR03803 family)
MPTKPLLIAAALAAALPLPSLALAADQGDKVLYSFPTFGTGFPYGNVLRESGALVGTASGEGNNRSPYGQIFMLRRSGNSWTAKKLAGFNGQNGATPLDGLTGGSKGTYYGTTSKGGAYGQGMVFELSKSGQDWSENILYAFQGGKDGAYPGGRLVVGKGVLYGADSGGDGEVFQLKPTPGSWTKIVLHAFGGRDGKSPTGGLIRDPGTGNLYGSTYKGGASGCGTVFALTPSAGQWKFQTIYSFQCGSDGANPDSELIEDSSGALYGTTYAGGYLSCGNGSTGCGTVFRLAQGKTGWHESVVHAFAGSDGAYPQDHGGLAMDEAGTTIYGTVSQGGQYYRGAVFKVSTSGTAYAVVHSFGGAGDGEYPQGGVTLDRTTGTLYGTTFSGGAYGYRTVYQIAQ